MFAGDDDLLFGDAAERRGIAEPERLIREFKRRIGDDVPIVAGSRRFAPAEVFALTVSWVVDLVSEREGRLPSTLAVTVPVSWGGYRVELVKAALAREGWGSARVLTEPEAAAHHYESTSPLEPGHALAVYDLGGGTFDAIVLRKDKHGKVAIVGDPVGLGDVGGADFDDAVLRHTIRAAGLDPATLVGDSARIGLATLRREAVDAKESLSFDSEVVIPVLVGGNGGTVRLTRSELEGMIDERIDRTTDALADALDGARVSPSELDAILLTGGSSRIPRVAQVLSERFDRPIATDADPKAIIALGAVRAAAEAQLSDALAVPVGPPVSTALAPVPETTAAEVVTAEEQVTDAPFPVPSPVTAPPRRRKWRLAAIAGAAGGTIALAVGFVVSSPTATGNGTLAASEHDVSAFFDDILAGSLGSDPVQAAELPSTPALAPVANTQPNTDAATKPSTKPSKRSAPPATPSTKAETPSPRSAPPTSQAGSSNATSPSPRSTPPASSGSGSAAAPSTNESGSSNPNPSSSPSSEPTTPATPSQEPTTTPTTDPTPTQEPTQDPTPTTDPTQPSEPSPEPPAPTAEPTQDPVPSETPSDPAPTPTEPTPEG